MNHSTKANTITREIRLFVFVALLVLLTGLLAVAQPARAADYKVTTSADSGTGSLRWAIDQANANNGPDTITFAASTNSAPIILTGAPDDDINLSGDLDILNNGDLTILGNGAGITIIDGGGIDRVFHVCPGLSCANMINFTGVTIRNGKASGGGGIYNAAGTTIVDSSIVSDNEAVFGGGIFNRGTLKVQNGSTIGGAGGGNQSLDGYGGGIYNAIGTTTVDNSTVSANTARTGGGISNAGTLKVQNGSSIGEEGAGNIATSNGGGIFNDSIGTTTVNASTVSYNHSYDGGGIFNSDTLNVENGSIIGGNGAGNTAANGGGIFNDEGTTTVSGSDVSANTATSQGGGIFNYEGVMTVVGSTVSANEADEGGGIYDEGGTTTVDGGTVSANEADEGGGILVWFGALIVKNGSTVGGVGAGNTAINNGGGIYNHGGTTQVTGSRILNNTAAAEGGGVYNNEDLPGATSVTGSCIVGNSDTSFFNNQPSQQIATINWWGAADGPDTAGADTTGGDVDTGGYLNTPILGCAPDLQVSKTNDTGGNGIVETPFHWTLTVSNTGLISATFGIGQKILIDDLPAGPTYGAPVTGSFVDVANYEEILCSLADNILTCKAGSADVTLGPLTGSFEVTISVTSDAPQPLINPDAGGICNVDPDGNVTENDENNNDCPENVVTVLDPPDLTVSKGNDTDGNGIEGTPFHWALTVSNTGPSSATFGSGDTILKDDLPAGPTYGAPLIGSSVNITNGDKIQCGLAGDTLTCTAVGGDVTFESVDSFFDVTFSVTPDAPGTLVNPYADGICKVDPDGKVTEDDEDNNDCPENTVDVSVSTNYVYMPVVLKQTP